MKKLFLILFIALTSIATWAEEQSIYSGPMTMDGSNMVTMPASKFEELSVGDVIRVYVSKFTSSDKGGTARVATANGEELFPDESQWKVYGDFSIIVSAQSAGKLIEGGLSIGGENFTIEEITLEHDPRTKVLFSGSVSIAYYTPTISIPSWQFANAKIGDIIQVKVKDLNSTSRGCLQNSDWTELKAGYSGFELTGDYSLRIDADVLRQIQEGALRVRGAYHTVTSVTLYCPSSGYDINPGNKREAPMMFGLNESGGEFAGIYPGIDGTHYGYPNKADLQYAHDKGFGIIRLPFRWERVLRPLGSTSLIKSEIDKLKQVLDWADELNLRVIFDMHNFGRYCTYCNGSSSANNVYAVIGEKTCTVQHFADVWRLLAKEFKGYTCIWAYEIMNEPYSMRSDTPWVNIAQAAIYAIREVDTETPIMVDGDSFATARNWVSVSDNLRTLIDPADNLIFSAHCYYDKDSSGNYNETYENSGANAQTGVTRTKPFVEWCKKYGLRGLVGEYGIPDNDSRWNTVLENMLAYLQENGIGGTYWSAGHRWGDYKLAVHPTNNYKTDRPQMKSLLKYQYIGTGIDNVYVNDNDEQWAMNDEQCAGNGNGYYNLMGMRVSPTTAGKELKGLYIHKGKKVIIK